VCAVALVAGSWVVRELVDRNEGYFSRNEMRDWLTIMSLVAGACLVSGLAPMRSPLGRGIVLGTVVAVLLVMGALVGEVVLTSA
jgi:hypothetical protein